VSASGGFLPGQPRLRRLRFGLSADSAGTGSAGTASAVPDSAGAGAAVPDSAGAGAASAGSAGAGWAAGACCALVYWASTASGIRPRGETGTPFSLAHARTAEEFPPCGRPGRSWPRLGIASTRPARRAAATNRARLSRRLSACSVDRSISYVRPSTAKRIVSAAAEPSMSSVSWTMVVRANGLPPGRVVVLVAMLGLPARPHRGSLFCAGTRWCVQRRPPAESVSRRLLLGGAGCTCRSLSGKQKGERPGWNRLGRQRTAGRLLAAGRDSSGGTAQLPATRAR